MSKKFLALALVGALTANVQATNVEDVKKATGATEAEVIAAVEAAIAQSPMGGAYFTKEEKKQLLKYAAVAAGTGLVVTGALWAAGRLNKKTDLVKDAEAEVKAAEAADKTAKEAQTAADKAADGKDADSKEAKAAEEAEKAADKAAEALTRATAWKAAVDAKFPKPAASTK